MGKYAPHMKFWLACLLLLTVTAASAQKMKLNHLTTFDEKRLHFGFTLGINALDFSPSCFPTLGDNPRFASSNWTSYSGEVSPATEVRTDVAQLIPGFTVAMVSNLRMTRTLDLRFLPGMSFGERKLKYNIEVIDAINTYNQAAYDYSIKSTFIDLPLLIKYKADRINNGRPYVIFGGAMRIDISKFASSDLVGLTRDGYYAELGAGWDSYLQFFRLSVEAKVSLGLNNQLGPGPREDSNQREYYTDALRSLRSNVFTLSFHFE